MGLRWRIEFINKIDDTVEGIRTLQSDVEFGLARLSYSHSVQIPTC